jgi:hypothetical protein
MRFFLALAFFVTTPVLSLAGTGDECVYVYDAQPHEASASVRFSSDTGEIFLTVNGVESSYWDQSAGTGIANRAATPKDGSDPILFRVVDLSKIAKKGAPDHVLIFGSDPYWPVCD